MASSRLGRFCTVQNDEEELWKRKQKEFLLPANWHHFDAAADLQGTADRLISSAGSLDTSNLGMEQLCSSRKALAEKVSRAPTCTGARLHVGHDRARSYSLSQQIREGPWKARFSSSQACRADPRRTCTFSPVLPAAFSRLSAASR